MDPVKVPQHLDLQDVVAWGMGAVDLLCLVASLTTSWWTYLILPGEPPVRAVLVAPFALAGLACAAARVGDLALREWLVIAAAYVLRPRVLVLA